ncbi:MAG: hypothetical protein KatS3mg059_0892 [Thermomicrobiales bacterium]|nr:MAG: hypothetical protein KatS3mg059_0892 [Thermomicrobiales bacterium]
MKVAGLRKIWLLSVILYTAGGVLSAALLGLLLGALGRLVVPADGWRWAMVASAGIGALAVVRETIAASVPIPQLRRQTPELWRFGVPLPVSASLWGIELGLVFTTWTTFAGPWFLAAIAVAGGNPAVGMALFVAHWLGRSAWLWAAPYLIRSSTAMPEVMDEILRAKRLFAWIHVGGLVGGLAGIAVWVTG